ncbi:MAG TPA: pirin family protein [Candidatus Acidoferrales bacterium]
MTQIIRAGERYHHDAGWLSTYWHFSFDHYHDPANIQFGPLRVFNDDVVQPSGGFPMHAHREMEIVTYVLSGTLEHRDSLGNTGQIGPGEVQRMSAGTGIRHSEYNPSETEPLHLLQLWVIPAVRGLAPSWEQKQFTREQRTGRLLPVAVPAEKGDGNTFAPLSVNGAVSIHQDATIYVSRLEPGQQVTHTLGEGRRAYLFVTEGEVRWNGETLRAGDQARITDTLELRLAAGVASAGDLLLIDLP